MPPPTMRSALAVSCLVSFMSGSAAAGGGAATDAYDEIDPGARLDVHGFRDLFALRNFNDPVSGKNQLREVDFPANTGSLGYARVTLAHRPRRVGFRVDAGAGDTATVFAEQDPASDFHPEVASRR